MHGGLMVCGTTSDAGKSTVVAGVCRLLARRGVSVAPFKGQNMSLNSMVTPDGAEIGRAQWLQAVAAGVEAEAAMNPVLLKPTSERAAQVVVMGRPTGLEEAGRYHHAKEDLIRVVDGALADLRARFDVVVCEGAGSPAEINLLEHDLVNLGLARRAGLPAVLVGDIERGGVFAHLFGTLALLPDELSSCVRGFVLNRFRGDPALLGDAMDRLEERCGVPTLGVLPYVEGLFLDAEDSLALGTRSLAGFDGTESCPAGELLDVAAVRLPRLSNFTDLDPLALEPGVALRWVDRAGALGRPDLIVLPGTRSTMADLEWLHVSGLAACLEAQRSSPAPPVVLGICGGFQMLGRSIEDPESVESQAPARQGLDWLPVRTVYEADKVTRLVPGTGGYEVRHGRSSPLPGWRDWLERADVPSARDGPVFGTTLHGLFEDDELRGAFLADVARFRGRDWQPSGGSFAAARQRQIDRVADLCEAHLDTAALWRLLERGALHS